MTVQQKRNAKRLDNIQIRQLFKETAEKLFEQQPAWNVNDLEEEIRKQCIKHLMGELLERLPNTGRIKWMNEFDWVKANWTRKNQTVKLGENLVWLPCVGNIDCLGDIAKRSDCVRAILSLERLL